MKKFSFVVPLITNKVVLILEHNMITRLARAPFNYHNMRYDGLVSYELGYPGIFILPICLVGKVKMQILNSFK